MAERARDERVEALATSIGHLAAEALLVETRLTPKPGLVDAENTGAHDDMDLATFEASAAALRPWLVRCAEAGVVRAKPADLVVLGLAAEADMRAATGGVNTHKGALYSLGLVCAAAGGLLSSSSRLADRADVMAERAERDEALLPGRADPLADPATDLMAERAERDEVPADLLVNGRPATDSLALDVCARAAELASAISPPPSGPPTTHGERAYAQLGLAGARGEAWGGFPRVRHHGLPTLARYRSLGWADDDALLATLVRLMAVTPDTNLIARGGEPALRAVWAWARGLVDAERRGVELRGEAFLVELRRADRDFSARRWSPGGSADLLALTWFLDHLPTLV